MIEYKPVIYISLNGEIVLSVIKLGHLPSVGDFFSAGHEKSGHEKSGTVSHVEHILACGDQIITIYLDE